MLFSTPVLECPLLHYYKCGAVQHPVCWSQHQCWSVLYYTIISVGHCDIQCVVLNTSVGMSPTTLLKVWGSAASSVLVSTPVLECPLLHYYKCGAVQHPVCWSQHQCRSVLYYTIISVGQCDIQCVSLNTSVGVSPTTLL